MKRSLLLLFIGAFIFIGCVQGGDDETKNNFHETDDNYYLLVDKNGKNTITIPAEYKNQKFFISMYNAENSTQNTDTINVTNGSRQITYKNKDLNLNFKDYSTDTFQNVEFHHKFDSVKIKNNSRNIKNNTNFTTYSNSAVGDIKSFTTVSQNDEIIRTECLDSELMQIGKYCNVWYKKKDGITIDDNTFIEVKNYFDKMYEIINLIFGNNYYDDIYSNIIETQFNNKVNIVIYDIFSDYETTARENRGTFGLFTGYNFYKKDGEGGNTYSNECQIIYIDSYFLEVAKEKTFSTLAHEYQHLLNYVNKILDKDIEYDAWFTEMLSMLCEDMIQKTIFNWSDNISPKSRLIDFNLKSYNGFKIWGPSDCDVLDNYANAYAFGAFLVRNFGGFDLLSQLACNEYANEESINDALMINGYEETFDSVLSKFCTMNDNSKFGLNKKIESEFEVCEKNILYIFDSIDLFKYKTFTKNLRHDTLEYDYLYFIPNRNSQNQEYYVGPIIYKYPYCNTKILPGGVQTCFLGNNIDKIEINKNSKIKYVIYSQN